jgi:hypothetical protein
MKAFLEELVGVCFGLSLLVFGLSLFDLGLNIFLLLIGSEYNLRFGITACIFSAVVVEIFSRLENRESLFFKTWDKDVIFISKTFREWRSFFRKSDSSGDYSREIARSPAHDMGGTVTHEISQTPVQPYTELEIARSPRKVEVLSPPIQVSPTQNPTPTQVIDVQPEKEVVITKESADQGKNFF